ncbi:BTB/POZ domain-containing protein [Nymphaea thermarum]|nr:BTB/POZ domain-containing protein [Nymphaea thermarum]
MGSESDKFSSFGIFHGVGDENRIFSQEIPSDVTVHAGGANFSLHKFPLVSKCGYIRKVVAEASDADLSFIEIPDIPGGAEAFELAARFCYGINFEISTDNIAMLRCVAEYLEMTEDYAVGNLVSRAEAYINEVALKSLSGSVSVLHQCEKLNPMAEKVKLINRCIDAVAYVAYQESQFSSSGITDSQESLSSSASHHRSAIVDWWAEDLTLLRIDIFQRVLMAMKARGFNQSALGPVLMLYAQKSLRGLEIFGRGRKVIELKQEHEKRVILETIVSLLPGEKNSMSAHPTLSDMERKKVCSMMDCQKLSREACAHAAQNDRLPVQTVVQVLYYEQQRLRDTMNGNVMGAESPAISKLSTYSSDHLVADELSCLRRENEDLKLELVKMRMRLKELEKPPPNTLPAPVSASDEKPPLPRKSFMNTVSKKLGRLYPFMRAEGVKPLSDAKVRGKPNKDRRHSIS